MTSLKNVKPRKAPAQRRAIESVEKILSATKELLDTVGIDQISTNRIAVAANFSTGAIYNFFPNKEAILYSIVDGWLSDLRQEYTKSYEELNAGSNAHSWIDDVLERNIEYYKAEPIIARNYNALTVLPDLRKRDIDHDARVTEILADAQQHFAPSLNRLQAQANAMTMVQMIHGVLSKALSQEEQYAEKMRVDLRFCLYSLVSKYLI